MHGHRRARRALALATLLATLGGIWFQFSAGGAQAETAPTVQVSPALGAPGGAVTLQGSGWPAGASVTARLSDPSIPDRSAPLGMSLRADAGGNFFGRGTVPSSLFGGGSRGHVTVVPGSYTITASSDAGQSASAPFTVGPAEGESLLWGAVVFDTNGNGQIDPTDRHGGEFVSLSVVGPNPSSPSRQATTDSRGRFLLRLAEPGSYTVRAEGQFQDNRWKGNATAQIERDQAVKLDMLLAPDLSPSHPERYFVATGFAIDNDSFWDYFTHRGGVRTLGYPISRTFRFQGYPTQFFQRLILQEVPGQGVQRLNLLDPGLLPYTGINGSQFPPVMEEVKRAAPRADAPDYDTRVVDFIQQHAPNDLDGRRVGFFDAFMGTVTSQDAFPEQGGHEELLPLLNLEIWGVPTSRPMPDPGNSQFVYLRFQRGILHYQGQNAHGKPITEGILLGDWFKSLITGNNLPADLEAQARAANSPYLRQYDPNRENWVARPDQHPDTNLAFAFQPQ